EVVDQFTQHGNCGRRDSTVQNDLDRPLRTRLHIGNDRSATPNSPPSGSGGYGRRLRHSVDIDDISRSDRRDGRAGNDCPDQVARVSRVDDDSLAGARKFAGVRQLFDRLGKRELLAGEAVDEAPAADEPTVLEPAKG